MATQKIKVDLLFNANTQQAQAELKKLSDSLQKVQNRPGAITDAFGFDRAAESARLLEKNLKAAVDVNTGKLNLSKFAQGLKHSNQSLEDIYNNLKYFGIEGEQIFNSLAKSISLSDASMLKVNDKLKKMIKTLGSAMRWEISSKVLRGFESALNNAYGYAQDLNKSLNDIRIVTGYNTDQMAKFAKEANKAAKALSTTTTDYTKASLIYYQQGLTDKEVQERTNATVKMANVTGTAAEEVSSQLTAVWNNFADGSKNLEYYADVMTALGAATASSSDEISQGLNKFAATAQTVGLSYEYAASALATVTAATRESADVVGTAFKTLFARIQDLELGETLDDGTTLGSYSQALKKVGIDIKDNNDQIKTMDTLLTEIAGKWQTMSKDAQIALAESVAGTRQYTQLMALMNNWGSFQENLQVSYSSSGTLNEQAEIYAESWEAAEKRVTASAEEMYAKIINDEAFIKLTNGFAKLIDFTSDVVDGFGGVAGVMATIGSIVMNKYAKEMPQFFENLASNIRAVTGAADKEKIQQLSTINDFLSKSDTKEAEALQLLNKKQIEIIQNKKYYSEVQLKEYQQRINNIAAIADETAAYEKNARKLQINADLNERILKYKIKSSINNKKLQNEADLQVNQEKLLEINTKISETPVDKTEILNQLREQQNFYQENIKKIKTEQTNLGIFEDSEVDENIKKLKELAKELTEAEYYLKDFRQAAANAFSIGEDFGSTEEEKIEKIRQNLELFKKEEIFNKSVTKEGRENFDQLLDDIKNKTVKTLEDLSERFTTWADSDIQINTKNIDHLEDKITEIIDKLSKGGNLNSEAIEEFVAKIREAEGESIQAELAIKKLREEANRKIESNNFEVMIEGFGKITSGAMAGVAAVTSIANAIERLKDPDLSGWEKFTIIAGMLTSVIANVKTLSQTLDINTVTKTINAAATWILAKANKANADAIDESADNTKEDTKEQAKNAVTKTVVTYTRGKGSGNNYWSLNGKKTGWNNLPDNVKQKLSGQDLAKKLKPGQQQTFDFTEGLDGAGAGKIPGKEGPLGKFKELGGAFKKLGGSIAKVLPKIGAAAAAIAIVATVTVLAINQAEKYKKALENATKAAEKIAEAHQKAKGEYEKLANTIQTYGDLAKGMEELTKGTAAYTNALVEANDAALELIKNNPELNDQYYIEDGQIKFNEDALETLQQQEALRVAELSSNSKLADMQVNNRQLEYDQSKLAKKMWSGEGLAVGLSNAAVGAAAGALAGSILPGVGNIAGALVGGGIGLVAGIAGTMIEGVSSEMDDMNKVFEALGDNAVDTFASEDTFRKYLKDNQESLGLSDGMIDAMVRNTEAMEQLYISNVNLKKTNDALWVSAYQARQVQNDRYQNSGITNYLTKRAKKQGSSEQLQTEAAEYTEELRKGRNRDFWAQYLINVMGESATKVNENNLEGENYKITNVAGNYVQLHTKDEEGKWTKQRISLADAEAALQENYIMDATILDTEANIIEFDKKLNELGLARFDLIENKQTELLSAYENILADIVNNEDKIDFSAINKYQAAEIINDANFRNKYGYRDDVKAFANKIENDAFVQKYLGLDNDELKKIFLELDIDQRATKENLDEAWEALLQDYQNKQFYVRIDIGTSLQKAFKDLDFKTLQSLFEDETNGLRINWDEFLGLNNKERREFIDNYYIENVQGFAGSIAETIQTNKSKYASAKIVTENAKENYQTVLERLSGYGYSSAAGALEGEDFNVSTLKTTIAANQGKSSEDIRKALENILNTKYITPDIVDKIASSKFDDIELNKLLDTIALEEVGNYKDFKALSERLTEAETAYKTAQTSETTARQEYYDSETRQAEYITWQEQHLELTELNIERFKELNDQLEIQKDLIEDLRREENKAYGANRLKQLNEINKAVAEQNQLLDQQRIQNSNFTFVDKQKIIDLQTGIQSNSDLADFKTLETFNFDEKTGVITNYTEVMRAYEDIIQEREQYYKLNTKNEEDYQTLWNLYVKPLQEYVDSLTEKTNTYDEDRTRQIDIENQIAEGLDTILSNNYDILTYKIELEVELNEMELDFIETQIGLIKDDFYQMAEAAALLYNQGANSKVSETLEQYQIAQGAYNELEAAYSKGLISQKDYVDGLKNQYDTVLNNIEALTDLDKEMLEYYGNTIKMAQEELGKYTDRLEHTTSVVDHYKNLMSTLGKEMDYKNMNTVLKGYAETIKNQVDVAKSEYEMYAEQAAAKRELMNSVSSSDAAYELYRNEWEAAEQAMREAQDNMLSKTEEWAEAMKATIENELAGLGETLEKSLTGGMSFDELGTSMERAASLQEEYLTSTNKIYETTKLMRTAQNAMDATTNSVAKQKLQNYINETKALQNSTKLSKYELDIQQAKYDLLLAEIALQDAQNAKTKVRLTRDAEGNFGYVYTADQNKVNEAQQKFEDAQNKLYNIGLDGANEYVEKYQQTMQQMYDELTSLQSAYLNGEITTQEEYNRRQNEIQAFYYQKLKDYSSLYQVALTTDSRVVADAWSTDFADMTYRTDEWMNNVNDYISQVEDKFVEWQDVIDEVELNVDVDFTNMETAIGDVTRASEALRDEIVDDVIPAIETELEKVGKITEAYAPLRSEILLTIEEYLRLAEAIKAAHAAQVGDLKSEYTDPGNVKVNPEAEAAKAQMIKYAEWLQDMGTGYADGGTRWSISENGQRKMSEYGALSQYINEYKKLAGNQADQTLIKKIIEAEEKMINDPSTKPTRFASGGYTGAWGPEGKLAILDEKELVLNQNDTANFLASLDLLHDIIGMIDLQAANAQASNSLSMPQFNYSSGSLEQSVHIEASFPGVTDRTEIEEAFNNLVNKASQYANRK